MYLVERLKIIHKNKYTSLSLSQKYIFTCGFADLSETPKLLLSEELTDVIEVAGALVTITIGFPMKLVVFEPPIPLNGDVALV